MDFRLAAMDDLPQLKVVFKEIINRMNEENIQIWDEIYPCDFFESDIEKKRLYVLEENGDLLSAFALCDSNAGAEHIAWENSDGKALYIDRLGVNVDYARKGIGGLMLNQAISIAKEKGAGHVRLFAVDMNKPAINLYLKSGFRQADGFYDEVIDDALVLHELGFEIQT